MKIRIYARGILHRAEIEFEGTVEEFEKVREKIEFSVSM